MVKNYERSYKCTDPLHNLLPNKLNHPLRKRGHDFELPIIKTERFKNVFINRCLFNFILKPCKLRRFVLSILIKTFIIIIIIIIMIIKVKF